MPPQAPMIAGTPEVGIIAETGKRFQTYRMIPRSRCSQALPR